MSKHLKISEDLSIPIDVVTQKLGAIGRTGSGKTYFATKLAEDMYNAGAQIIAIDVVGVWWGLRLSADGKSPGLSIPVFGGLHGDIPLEPTSGKLIADLIVDKGISVVLDISQFESDADKTKFATDFADKFFFRKKSSPSAVHLFLEECQELIPQNIQRGEERMLHAYQRIIRLGRNFGIGATMITQRPQDVNKKALNQAECVFAFQLTGPQERKAIDLWMSDKGLDLDLANDLPKLNNGEAHVWSPSWLKISKVVKIGKKNTFNASSTPEVGRKSQARELAKIDLDNLRDQMQATIERAKADDPKELRKKIADLEKQLKSQPKVSSEIKKVEIPAFKDSQIKRLEDLFVKISNEAEKHGAAMGLFWKNQDEVAQALLGALQSVDKANRQVNQTAPRIQKAEQPSFNRPSHRTVSTTVKSSGDNIEIAAGAKRMLASLVQWSPNGLSEGQMRSHAGMKNSGSFSQYKSSLRQQQLAEQNNGLWYATQKGIDYLGYDIPSPQTTQDVMDVWLPKLAAGARRMLEVLVEHPKHAMSDQELQEAIGMSNSGSYSQYKSSLRTARLITTSGGMVYADKETLFL